LNRSIHSRSFESFGTVFLFAFDGNFGRIFSSFDTVHERDRQALHGGIGRAYA